MSAISSIQRFLGVAGALALLAGCAPRAAPPPPPPPSPMGAAPGLPIAPPSPSGQPMPEAAPPPGSDFVPCTGASSGQTSVPGADRALIAFSTDGLDWQRPENPADAILLDRISVPDAVILPSGRVLVYFVDGCRPPEVVEQVESTIIVAVSDQQGSPGSWSYKNVRFTDLPDQYRLTMVDPNVVLLPDGSLRLMVTLFWREGGAEKHGAFSFASNDGGFTYSFLGLSYADIVDPEHYRFTDADWQIITGGTDVPGYAMSRDDGNTFSPFGDFPARGGVVHEIAATEVDGQYRAYVTTPDGIQSFLATSSPWTTWTEEPGYRLRLDGSTGLESCEIRFPTVLKLGPGRYMMIYETVIPGCGCEGNPVCR